ncbi:hypothetical protein Rsub_08895 [Raphidocelis subcapitata]|uniref:BP28 C-terminal domain-containing protein n=1 Tax=Raphidocelis subcapitata TaxID=307507 RepID=A0A2V0PG15_9CHLO|nr:hypothetical protein Rsub_08895 [Raphidocelis subcapitata]|eukprot:GBF96147.1 hypothetical protein Rsub_08895 [Raphidocelis subcapitata]
MSLLAAQLAQLSALKGPQEKWVRGKASLLFDYQQAADVGADTLLSIAQTGLAQLARLDKRFQPFGETLFSRAALSVARDQLTAAENEALDGSLNALLHLLADHFLSPATFQVLEFCVRRYRVHEHNLPALFAAALPYHSTNEFVRLVQICALKGTIWEWLSPIQTSGAALPRASLVQRCVRDQAVLRFVCKAAEALGSGPHPSRTFLSFFAVTVCELLAAAPQVSEDLVTLLLPQLVAGLGPDAGRDLASATFMVCSHLASRATLGVKLLNVVTTQVARTTGTMGVATPLMLLAHIANTQPQLAALPRKALQHLAAQAELADALSALQSKGARLGPLARLLLSGLCDALSSPEEGQSKAAAAASALAGLCHQLELEPHHAEEAAAKLLAAGAALLPAADAGGGDDEGGAAAAAAAALERVSAALRALDLRYPAAVDAAVNAALGEGAAAAAGPQPPPAAKGKKAKAAGAAAPDGRGAVFDFVQRSLGGSSHAPVPGGAGGGAQTLAAAVHAPAEGVRIMAIERLDEICAAPDAAPEARQLLASSLLDALRHDAFGAAAAAAAARGLAALPADDLLGALRALLARAAAVVAAGKGDPTAAGAGAGAAALPPGSGKLALRAARRALSALADLARREPGAARDCAAAVLEQALADKRRRKLARAAAAACAGGWHPLLAPLGGVALAGDDDGDGDAEAEAEAGGGAAAKTPRKAGGRKAVAAPGAGDAGEGGAAAPDRRAAVAEANRAVADALAQGLLAGGPEVWDELSALLPLCGPRSRHLLLLALARAASQLGAPGRAGRRKAGSAAAAQEGVARALVALLPGGAAGGAAGGQLPSDWQAAAGRLLDDEAAPAPAHSSAIASPAGLESAHGAVLLQALYAALDATPPAALAAALGQPEAVFALLARHAYPVHPHGQPQQQQQQQQQQQHDKKEAAVDAAAADAAAAAAAAAEDGGAAFAALSLHLCLIVAKCAAGRELEFLEGFYSLPREAARWSAQAAALRLLALDTAAGGAWLPDGARRGGPRWLARALGAAGSPSPQVRAAAARLLSSPGGLRAALARPGAGAALALEGAGGIHEAHLAAFCEALEPHAALLRANPRALALLLRGAFAAAGSAGAGAGDDADAPAAGGAGKTTGGRGRSRGKHAQGAAAAAAAAAAEALQNALLSAPEAALRSLEDYIIDQLPALASAEGLPALALAAAALPGASPPARLFDGAAPLIATLLRRAAAGEAVPYATATPGHAAAGPPEAQQAMQALCVAAAVELLPAFAPGCVAGAPEDALEAVLRLLEAPLAANAGAGAGPAPAPALRAAALRLVTPHWFAALPPPAAGRAFRALLLSSAADADAAGRALARGALEALPVDASALLPLLEPPAPAPAAGSAAKAPRAKRARGGAAAASAGAAPMDVDGAAASDGGGDLSDLAVSALELLQWKEVSGASGLVAPLHALLAALLPRLGSIAVAHGGGGGGEEEGDEEEDGVGGAPDGDAAAAAAAAGSAAAGYASQLVLLALRRLAAPAAAAAAAAAPPAAAPRGKKKAPAAAAAAALPEGFDVSLVLSALAAAPDAALRNAALGLLAVLARAAPDAMLSHVLEALRLIQASAAATDDSHSQATAAAALAAVAPAWVAAGRDPSELWAVLAGALGEVPAHRRLALLATLLKALPKEAGLSVAVLVMLRRSAADAAAAAADAAPAAKPARGKGRGGKKQAAAAAEEEEEEAEAEAPRESDWMPELAAALCDQVPSGERLAALSSVLEASAAGAEPSQPLPRLAVLFVTAQLGAKGLSAAARAESAAAAAAASAAADADAAAEAEAAPASPVLAGCLAVMQQALLQLQALRPESEDGGSDSDDDDADGAEASAADRRGRRAVGAACSGLYGLLRALRELLAPGDYLGALLRLADHESEAVRRRALGLYADRVAALHEDGREWEEGLDAAAARDARRRLAAAAMALCGRLPVLLAPGGGDVARQTALLAADAAFAEFGAARPADALAALPHVTAAAAAAAAPPPLRAAALGALASAAAALGPRLVPLLPAVAAAALDAADAALASLEALGGPGSGGGDDSDGEGAAADADGNGEAREEAGLLLAASLAALEALVAHLGAFVSPHLPRLLAVALAPTALSCRHGGASARAARLRRLLTEKVPPRLLVDPLAAAWDGALASCARVIAGAGGDDEAYVEGGAAAAAPAVAHLEVVAGLAAAMDHRAAAAHADPLYALLLRALDTRQRQLSRLAGAAPGAGGEGLDALRGGGAAAVEAAACAALVALVMKLSESKFKPLFLRAVDWAAAASAAAAGAGPAAGGAAPAAAAAAAGAGLGRVAALLAAACALSRRLRGVFTPYYKHLLEILVAQLLSPLPGESADRPKKKRRKASDAAADAGAAGGADGDAGGDAAAAAALAGWLCRVRAMRALHLLASHSGPGPMEPERFSRLLAPLARQLSAPAPADGPPGPRRLAAALSAQTADPELDGPPTALALLGPAGLAAANAATGARAADANAAAAAAPPPAPAADAAAAAAAGALVALGLAAASDAAWKPLAHAALGAARAAASGAGVRTKLLALGVVSRLVAALREEWLVLVPEVLPYLAELVEDGEPLVEAAAQGLLAQLEEVSGEKLDDYLRA